MAKKINRVKRTKGNLNLLIIVFLAVGWICALTVATSDTAAKEQAALIEEAQGYLEDKLYIRAVNNYKSAISDYNTEDNLKLETELLNIYLQAEMMGDYYALMAKRIDKKTAAEEEYLILAQHYVASDSIPKALAVLNSGVEQFENEEMTNLRESIRYECKTKVIDYSVVEQLTGESVIPAFNGEKWGYVTENGKVSLDFIYEEAIDFCGSYAVVKLDGVYTLIDKSGYWNAIDKNGLDEVKDISSSAIIAVKDGKYRIYSRIFGLLSEEEYDNVYMNDDGTYMVQKDGKWAILSASLEPVTKYIFTDVAVNSKGNVFQEGLAIVKDEEGYFHIDETGEPLYKKRFADAKGFEGGFCAVSEDGKKWGFANSRGEIIVECQYTDALSFSSNLAAVQYAGKWGYINKYNTMIIEPEYEEAYPFVDSKALVKTEQGSHRVLNLKYFDLFE